MKELLEKIYSMEDTIAKQQAFINIVAKMEKDFSNDQILGENFRLMMKVYLDKK